MLRVKPGFAPQTGSARVETMSDHTKKSQNETTRRNFLKSAAVTSAALSAPTFIPARVLGREGAPGANEEIIIGVIGTGNRANQLMDQVPPPGRIVALADCFKFRATETARKKKKPEWAIYQDYRQMFDKEKLDAVMIATPDHARTLPCIRAVQAGYDVYAEKPLTAYIQEGRILVDHVRKNNKIFQVGTQQRTMEINRFCCALVRDGKIGKVEQVSAVNYPGSRKYQQLPEEPVPATDDWDTWCGPTPLRPFNNK